MKRIGIGAFALFAPLVTMGLLRGPQPARAQTDPDRGWIEGVIVNDKGEAAGDRNPFNNAVISVRPVQGDGIKTFTDRAKGGFYTFRNLKPGVYEVFVDATERKDREDWIACRPQHFFGLVVEAGKRTELNITVHDGKELETIGKPTVPTQKAIIISEEMERMKAEIAELKKQIEELKK